MPASGRRSCAWLTNCSTITFTLKSRRCSTIVGFVRAADRFSAKTVVYLMRTYGLRSRYDRLRERGMLNKREMADRLGVHAQTVDRWTEFGLIKAHFYNDHGWQLYEPPEPNTLAKHSSRWDRLMDRAAALQAGPQNAALEMKEM